MEAKELINELERKGFTQQEIAKHIGVSQSAVSLIKNGKRTQVRHSTYVSLINLCTKGK